MGEGHPPADPARSASAPDLPGPRSAGIDPAGAAPPAAPPAEPEPVSRVMLAGYLLVAVILVGWFLWGWLGLRQGFVDSVGESAGAGFALLLLVSIVGSLRRSRR
ncbi:hypothetical protein [Plantactinospora sp. KBS50]|uniref:hypothetical protein n=1 Tax=Plantactinospora sp. KBS50 TaxID=2024580 RepID=UPI001E4B5813|nr:hypothetical protein [Plantactinospora sp. KBS50]